MNNLNLLFSILSSNPSHNFLHIHFLGIDRINDLRKIDVIPELSIVICYLSGSST